MYEELHFAGSPLDAYLRDFGVDVATGRTDWCRSAPHQVASTARTRLGRIKLAASSIMSAVQEPQAEVAKEFEAIGFLLEDAATKRCCKSMHGFVHLVHACVLLVTLLGVLRKAGCGQRSVVHRLNSSFLQRPALGVLVSCMAWTFANIFVVVGRMVSLRGLRWQAVLVSDALVAFWEVAGYVVEDVEREEKGLFKVAHVQPCTRRLLAIAKLDQQLRCISEISQGTSDRDSGMQEDGMPLAFALRAWLTEVWDLQTIALRSVLGLVKVQRAQVAGQLLQALRSCIDEARCALLEEARLQYAWRIVGPTPSPLPHLVANSSWHLSTRELHSTANLVFALAGLCSSRGDEPVIRNTKDVHIFHMLERVSPHLDKLCKALLQVPHDPVVPGSRYHALYQAENGPPQRVARSTLKKLEAEGGEDPYVEDEGPRSLTDPQLAVVVVHEGEGSPPEMECAATQRLASDGFEAKQLGGRFWQACLDELRNVFAERALSSVGASALCGNSAILVRSTQVVLSETWGMAVDDVACEKRRTLRHPRHLDAAELVHALEARISQRYALPLDGRASASETVLEA